MIMCVIISVTSEDEEKLCFHPLHHFLFHMVLNKLWVELQLQVFGFIQSVQVSSDGATVS